MVSEPKLCLSGSQYKHLLPFNRTNLSSKRSLESNTYSVKSKRLLASTEADNESTVIER